MNHKESNLKERKAQIVYLWLRDSSQPTWVLNSFSQGAEANERLQPLSPSGRIPDNKENEQEESRYLSNILDEFVLY